MDFLLSHWHCIIPALVIVLAALLRNRDKNKTADTAETSKKIFSTGGKK
ncbi:MAG: hypothetical protein LBB83_12215 [Treponema sp.]|jgi:hypothetical protein|nr:hypothetical protein [Treponema sp.]